MCAAGHGTAWSRRSAILVDRPRFPVAAIPIADGIKRRRLNPAPQELGSDV
jgi:hypothetical protein